MLQGDESIAQRPMDRVTIPLRQMGARIDGRDGGRLAPLVIDGGGLHGIDYTPPVASAQVKSAVLLAGLLAEGVTVVREPVPTRRHTEEMLRDRGVDIVTEPDGGGAGGEVITLRPGPVKPGTITVPGDPSQSAFWICGAAAIPGSDLTVEGLYLAPERTGFLPVLATDGRRPRRSTAPPGRCGCAVASCTAPSSPATSCRTSSTRSRRWPSPRRWRSRACSTSRARPSCAPRRPTASTPWPRCCRALGAEVDTEPDRLVVHSRAVLHPGVVESHGDHRIAMAGAIAALAVRLPPARSPYGYDGWDAVATSYPGFLDDLAAVASAGG